MVGENLIGQTVGGGKYKLLARLGNGCFGTVYRAAECMDDAVIREVALKIYSAEATRMGNVEGMFEDCALPARILASDAPIEQKQHFVAIYDFGRLNMPEGECAYVSMELVRRASTLEDLTQRAIRSGHYPSEENVVGYMKQFFSALSLAHKAGVLHRDIKGANVMITDGILKIVDFGMGAYLNDPEAPLKTTLSIYAPENFSGRYTIASDIYQAGLMFYKYFVGYDPYDKQEFSSESQTEYAKKLRLKFQYIPSERFPEANASSLLDAVLSKCLRFAENTRFHSAKEVQDALEEREPSKVVQEALDNGNYDYALQLARKGLEIKDVKPADRVTLLWTMGNAYMQKNAPDLALEYLKKAYEEAERSLVFFHLPTRQNELISQICALYEQKGQAGMARLWNKKRK